jgi:hypothetical protein
MHWYVWGPLFLVGIYLVIPGTPLPRRRQSLDDFQNELRSGFDAHTGEIIFELDEVTTPRVRQRELAMEGGSEATYVMLALPPVVVQPAMLQLEATADTDAYHAFLIWREKSAAEWQDMLEDFDKAMKILAGE